MDDSPPEIVKTVGDPNCTITEGEEYCVTTETPVTINVTNLGCCDEGVVVQYNNGSGWVDITDVLPFTHYFAEECDHWLNKIMVLNIAHSCSLNRLIMSLFRQNLLSVEKFNLSALEETILVGCIFS